jgi:hypothetical protein
MHPTIERCAGLDVHQATVMATVRIPNAQGGRHAITETFSTTTGALVTLRDWLQAYGVTHVAMESTGVYWKTRLLPARGCVYASPGECAAAQATAGTEIRRARQRADCATA